LPKEYVDLLITHLKFYSIEPDQFLYSRDESESDFMFILLSGKVIRIHSNSDKKYLEAPALIGESAMLTSAKRNHTIRSIDDCKVAAIHRDVFKDLVTFVTPQHCSEGKELIEAHNLFNLLCKTQETRLVKGLDYKRYKSG
jgi:CRP-like cAMP-binding protein